MTWAPLQTDRRAALRSLAAMGLCVPVLSACDATDTTPDRSGGVQPTADAAAADAALVASLSRHIAALRIAATRLAKKAPDRRAWALDLASLHQQHLHKLGASSAHPGSVPAGTPTSLATAERSLQQSLVAGAGRAESGALAQVLASMGAAVEQRLVGV